MAKHLRSTSAMVVVPVFLDYVPPAPFFKKKMIWDVAEGVQVKVLWSCENLVKNFNPTWMMEKLVTNYHYLFH